MKEKLYPCGVEGCDDMQRSVDPPDSDDTWLPGPEESKFRPGSAERALADHLDGEGFGGWSNVDEVVDEMKRMGWSFSPIGKIDADLREERMEAPDAD